MPGYKVCIAGFVALAAVACSKSEASSDGAVADSSVSSSSATPVITNQVQVAARPANPCGWISQQEVESIIGRLAEPPRPYEGGCRYTLPVPEAVKAKRERYLKTMEALSKLPGADKMATLKAEPYAINVTVDIDGDITGERGAAAAGNVVKSLLNDSSSSSTDAVARDSRDGWDVKRPHGGRIGHVTIDVSTENAELELPRDKLDTLAVHVRNRIPDLPFAMRADYSQGESRDPCVLLSRQEVEAVLGPLVVAPYRSANDGPLAYPNGTSCSYFTRGHHVLIITPRWSDGKSVVAATHGVAGLVGQAIDNSKEQSADTLEGPWDQAAMDMDGRLALLKGDRLLQIHYLMSSADEAGALKLARPALERLASAH